MWFELIRRGTERIDQVKQDGSLIERQRFRFARQHDVGNGHPIQRRDFVTGFLRDDDVAAVAHQRFSPEFVKGCLAHGRNEDNVFETSMILMTLKDYIEFPNDKKIKIIILFSSRDNQEHLNALLKLTELLDEKDLYNQIKDLETSGEIYEKILSLTGEN